MNVKNSSTIADTPLVTKRYDRSSYKIEYGENSEFLREKTTCIENSAVFQCKYSELKPDPLSEIAVQNSEI